MLEKPMQFGKQPRKFPWEPRPGAPILSGKPADEKPAPVRVKREPTPEMLNAGQIAADDHVSAVRIAAIWRAMFDEAQKG